MVVTRKKPSAPAPPTSRTTSTQALPRAVNAQPTLSNISTTSDTHSDSSQPPDRAVPNGVSKLRTKPKKPKPGAPLGRGEKRSILDRLFFYFFAIFAAYALWVCPSDVHHESAVCRSLTIYRTRVLEPYVVPPIRAVVTHLVVVQPYEKYAKPIYQNYVQPVTPYVAAAQRRTAPYVNAAYRISKRTSLRLWNNILKPYWTRAIVPRYNLYIQPQVNKYVSPITKRVKDYTRRAEPHVRVFAHHTSVYAHKSRKYAIIAYDRVKPQVLRAYRTAAPHVSRAYAQVRPSLHRAFDVVQVKGKYLVSETMILLRTALGHVGDLRRQFVDPHILRIWEKAVEKSGPSSNNRSSSVVGATSTGSGAPPVGEFSDVDADPEDATVEMVVEPTPSAIPTVVSVPSQSITPVIVDATQEPEIPDAPTNPTPVPTPGETLEKAASVAEESAGHASSVIGEVEREIKLAEAEQVPITPTPAPMETPEPASNAGPAEPEAPVVQQAVVEEPTQEVEDLDDFLREIGLDDEEKIPEPEPEVIIPIQEEEDEETKKAATAAKRAAIVSRHVRWQSELDTLVKDLEGRVTQEIQAIRDEAIAHIGRLPSDKDESNIDGKGKEVMLKIQNDGEKLLKGLEAYVNKLKSQTITGDELEKEKEKWDKVVDKVEDKFKDIIRSVQEEVHDWYVSIREKEAGVVLAASREAKALADRAQADLGLDYAWLDDVSYQDWQKYHDLMRTSERFDQTVRSLANGTHVDAPEDKLVPVLNNLDHEVQDMIAGFAMKMNGLTREGDQSLSISDEPVPEQDAEDEEECEEEEEDPQVSILPISPEPVVEKVDPANVVIGKNAEQIEKMANQAIIDGRIEL